MKRISAKLTIVGAYVATLLFLVAAPVSAHVVVKPGEVLTGAYETFSVSVPNEKEVPVTGLKLEIPAELQSVTPSVKSGWQVQTDKEGTGETAKVKTITWSGGSIPAGQRDDFTFSAKAPAKPAELKWKTFQTYEDGTVVSWNLPPSQEAEGDDDDASNAGPYSITTVKSTAASEDDNDVDAVSDESAAKATTALTLGVIATLVSLVSLYFATRKISVKRKSADQK